MHWWRVGADTVWKWRKALNVGPTTEGTSRLRAQKPPVMNMIDAARPALPSPELAVKVDRAAEQS